MSKLSKTPLALAAALVAGAAPLGAMSTANATTVLTLEGVEFGPLVPAPWNEAMDGPLCQDADACREIPYPSSANIFGIPTGVKMLSEELANTEGDVVVLAYSQGTYIPVLWMLQNANNPDAPDPKKVSFVVMGSPFNKHGGTLAPVSALLPESPYHVTDVTRQYDPASDFPDNPLNAVALANAAAGLLFIHLNYKNLDLESEDNITWTEGNTTYIFIPTDDLPLLEPLRLIGRDDVADQLNDPLKQVVEAGYDRQIPAGQSVNVASANTLDQSFALPAGHSLSNIPINVLNAILSAPGNQILALQQLAAAFYLSGSLFVYGAEHLEGFDPADALEISALVNSLIPFPAFSGPLGDQINILAEAELPINAGCYGLPAPCADPISLFAGFFKVPIWDLLNGYTFPEIINPVDGSEFPWSEQTVYLEPLAPFTSVLNSLTAEPTGVTPVDPGAVLPTYLAVADSFLRSFDPLAPGSFLFGPPWPVPQDVTEPPWLDDLIEILHPHATVEGDAAVDDFAVEEISEASVPEVTAHAEDGLEQDGLEQDESESDASELGAPAEQVPSEEEGLEEEPEADAETESGRHYQGIPAYRLINSIVGEDGESDAQGDDDGRARGPLLRTVQTVSQRLNERVGSTVSQITGSGSADADSDTGSAEQGDRQDASDNNNTESDG